MKFGCLPSKAENLLVIAKSLGLDVVGVRLVTYFVMVIGVLLRAVLEIMTSPLWQHCLFFFFYHG